MRDTIHCLTEDEPDQEAITASVHAMVAEVQRYVPGYTAEERAGVRRPPRVSVFIEVEGLGDYLPKYAGNLDIMTAAALRTGEMFAEEMLQGRVRAALRAGLSTELSHELEGQASCCTTCSLRDGMHPKRHQITLEQMISVATALDAAGVPLIEVTHGDGLGGASMNYGFPAAQRRGVPARGDAADEARQGSALLLPGIGTVDHLHMADDCGVAHASASRPTAPRPTSPSSTSALAPKLGLDTVGFLMMAHMIPPEAAARAGEADGELRRQLHLLHRLGRLHAARRRDRAHRRCCAPSCSPRPRSASTATTTWPWASPTRWPRSRPARSRIDGSCAGLGAGAGNTPLEVFVAVLRAHGRRARRRPVQGHGRRRGPGRADDGRRRCASTATR